MGRTIYGTDNPETIDAADGVTSEGDTIFGHGGADHIYGLGGDDWLKGGGGADHLYGGEGNDTVDYGDSPGRVDVALNGRLGAGGTAQGDQLHSIENIAGSPHNDFLVGNGLANVLSGRGGPDYLWGGGGADTLQGGIGGDDLIGGPGPDILDGGPDIDFVPYFDSDVGVSVNLRAGEGFFGTAEGDTLISIEGIHGSYFDDVIVGDDADNYLFGYLGADTLKGGGGADRLWGERGLDTMYGEGGADTFEWRAASDTGLTTATADIVMDFNRVQGDRIDLSRIDANISATGDQAFTFIGTATFTLDAATPDPSDVRPGEIRYYHAGGDTYLEVQTGTEADIEGLIRLDGIHTPEASWFVL
jgi:serralysin